MSSKPRTEAQKAARRERDRKRREEQRKAAAKAAKQKTCAAKKTAKSAKPAKPQAKKPAPKPQTKNIKTKPNKNARPCKGKCSCNVKPQVFLVFCEGDKRIVYEIDITSSVVL